MFYKLVILLLRFVTWIIFSVKFEGLENIPKDEGFVLAGNHRTYYDPVFSVIKVPVPVNFMAKAELFENKIFGFLIGHLNSFPIERGTGDTQSIDHAVDVLQSGQALLMFIEGTRSKDGIPGRPRSGAAVISSRANVGILPYSIDYGKSLKFRTKIVVRYHKLISQEELGTNLEQPRTIRTASKMIMESVVSGLTHIPKKEDA